jgi:hypothetical protein
VTVLFGDREILEMSVRERFRRKTLRQKAVWIAFFVFLFPILIFVGWELVYEPLKFQYLIRRVESASTEIEEARAFELARRWGRVWETNELKPAELPKRARHLRGDWILELEWLESSAWTGKPYRAYRRVIATNNRLTLRAP